MAGSESADTSAWYCLKSQHSTSSSGLWVATEIKQASKQKDSLILNLQVAPGVALDRRKHPMYHPSHLSEDSCLICNTFLCVLKYSKYLTYVHPIVKDDLDDSCRRSLTVRFCQRSDAATIQEKVSIELSTVVKKSCMRGLHALSLEIHFFWSCVVEFVECSTRMIGQRFWTTHRKSNCDMQAWEN